MKTNSTNGHGLVCGVARFARGHFTFATMFRRARQTPERAREAIERTLSRERARLARCAPMAIGVAA